MKDLRATRQETLEALTAAHGWLLLSHGNPQGENPSVDERANFPGQMDTLRLLELRAALLAGAMMVALQDLEKITAGTPAAPGNRMLLIEVCMRLINHITELMERTARQDIAAHPENYGNPPEDAHLPDLPEGVVSMGEDAPSETGPRLILETDAEPGVLRQRLMEMIKEDSGVVCIVANKLTGNPLHQASASIVTNLPTSVQLNLLYGAFEIIDEMNLPDDKEGLRRRAGLN